MRKSHPQNFARAFPSAAKDIFTHGQQTVLEHRDAVGRRIFLFRWEHIRLLPSAHSLNTLVLQQGRDLGSLLSQSGRHLRRQLPLPRDGGQGTQVAGGRARHGGGHDGAQLLPHHERHHGVRQIGGPNYSSKADEVPNMYTVVHRCVDRSKCESTYTFVSNRAPSRFASARSTSSTNPISSTSSSPSLNPSCRKQYGVG